jgi:hypothetical protein
MAANPRSGADSRLDQFVHTTVRVKERTKMLWTLAVILLVLWLLGLVTSYTMGGLIHILLVVALVVVVLRIIQGRRIA